MLTHVDLFSGIGGFALAAEWAGFETIVFCEKDEYCQKILKKHWPQVPIIAEIRDFKWPLADDGLSQSMELSRSEQERRDRTGNGGQITLLTGGFPCQPFSVAGKRRGKEDDRYLWPEMFAVISQIRPTWVLAENVTGIINMELDKCLSDLEDEGYETEAFIIPACGVDAPHRRERVWIVAHSERNGRQKLPGNVEKKSGEACKKRGESTKGIVNSSQNAPDADKFNGHGGRSYSGKISQLKKAELSRDQDVAHDEGRESREQKARNRGEGVSRRSQDVADNELNSERATFRERSDKGGPDGQQDNGDSLGNDTRDGSQTQPRKFYFWPAEPDVGRVAYGVSSRVDRLKSLGNAIVPQVAYEIIKAIRMIEEKEGKE